jgi:GDPmannose 4,6-dehydratase
VKHFQTVRVSGQKLAKGYDVYGSSRDAQTSTFANLDRLGIRKQIKVVSLAINDFRSVLQVLNHVSPDEVYNLAGQSSVGLSFEQPVETLESISVGTLNLLEAIRFSGRNVRLYNAGSSECFGESSGKAADEETPFRPRSPYAVGKASAHWIIANYREAYNLFACTGILFNHESPLRPSRFVTKKIVAAACRIARGSEEQLHLGNIDIQRDWGWAPEYVEAMWLMMKQSEPEDFVIATGTSHSLKEFVETAFSELGLDWANHVISDPSLLRPTDILIGRGNPSKAKKKLGWQAKYSMRDVIKEMIAAERNRKNGAR